VARDPCAKGTPRLEELGFDPNDFGIINQNGEAYRDQPYILFAIEGSERREDYLNILERKNAWDQIGIAAKALRLNDAATLLKRFAVIASGVQTSFLKTRSALQIRQRQSVHNCRRRGALRAENSVNTHSVNSRLSICMAPPDCVSRKPRNV